MLEHSVKKVNWIELLYDLIFVYAISKATHILMHSHEEHLGSDQYITFILVMIPIWWAWTGHTLYTTRFDIDDNLQRILTLMQMLAVVFWTAFIDADFDANYSGYLLFYVVIRLILIFMYIRSARNNSKVIPIAKRLTFGFSLGLLIALSSLLFEPPFRYVVLYLGITVEILTPLVSQKLLKTIPVNAHHLPERYGLLTIILLGESIIIIASALSKIPFTPWVVISATIGFIMIATIWWIYFMLVENEIMGQNLYTGKGIIYGHLFLYLGFSSLAAYIGFSIEHSLLMKDLLSLFSFSIILLLIGFTIIFGISKLKKREYMSIYFLFLVVSTSLLILNNLS